MQCLFPCHMPSLHYEARYRKLHEHVCTNKLETFNLHSSPTKWALLLSHFPDEETEMQRVS